MTPDVLQNVAIQVAQCRTLRSALDAFTQGLVRTGGVALARVWLIDDGDRCDSCAQAPVCQTRDRCLHLSASYGVSLLDDHQNWSRLDGDFSRIPLNEVRKVGYVAHTNSPVLISDIRRDQQWVARPEWVKEEDIVSFAGQPLISMGETLGAIAVFSRSHLSERELGWLRTFADHTAVSIVNARAFDEIATLREQLEAERDYLRSEVKQAHSFGEIIGHSPALQALLRQIELVAPTDTSVLLQGESGTGKELTASAIHERSSRKDRALVRVNCASIPRELFESEFFGHVKGSFSGAVRDRAGRFELADGGSLFLDEVGEIPLELQSKLLRILQEGTFERVGDEKTRKVDVRVIAATNRDLKEEVAAGRFREDLYYRLSVFPLKLPTLRERRDDIPELAQHFLDLSAKRMTREPMKLTVAQVRALQAYDWPGNIRELQNIIDRSVILSTGHRIQLEGLLPTAPKARTKSASASGNSTAYFLTESEMRQHERDNLVAALRHAGGKVSGDDGAAALLGVNASTLASRIRKFRIERSEWNQMLDE